MIFSIKPIGASWKAPLSLRCSSVDLKRPKKKQNLKGAVVIAGGVKWCFGLPTEIILSQKPISLLGLPTEIILSQKPISLLGLPTEFILSHKG